MNEKDEQFIISCAVDFLMRSLGKTIDQDLINEFEEWMNK